MHTLSNTVHRISTGRITLLSLLVFLLFTAIVLPTVAEEAALRSEIGSPDTSFVYSADDLYAMAEAYGEEGRRSYIQERYTFDVAWPLIYTFMLCTSTSWLLQRTALASGRWRRLNLIPLAGAGFDLLENGLASIAMALFPEIPAFLADLTPRMTFVKWIGIGASFALALFLVGRWLTASLKSR